MATFFLAMITILLDGMPPQRIPLASGLSNFARITAGGFAASIVTTLWDRREALHQSRHHRPDHDLQSRVPGQAVTHLHQLRPVRTLARSASLARTITGQAYLLAANDIFWASGWICIALIGMVWLCRRAVSAVEPMRQPTKRSL